MVMHLHPRQRRHDAQTTSHLAATSSVPHHLYPTSNDRGDTTGHKNRLYRPIWLTPHFLVALSLIFTALWATLIILFRVVSSQDGLSFTITSSHYAWTYGPSTILIVLLGIWRQVDYHCKLTQPWREMISGPSHPDRSVLLDYVSPMQVVTLAKSLNHKHFPVALSVAGFGVLKLAILLSTSLFVPEQTLHSEQRPVQYKSSFDAIHVWESPTDRGWAGWSEGHLRGWTPPRGTFSNVSDAVVWGYVKQLNGQTLDPAKVMGNTVHQSFDVLGPNENITSTTAHVDAFQPNITCEDAMVGITSSPQTDNSDLKMSLKIRSNTCYAVLHERYLITRVRPEPIIYDVTVVNCSSSTAGDKTNSDMDTRIVVTALDINFIPVPRFPNGSSNGSYSTVTLNKGTSVVCKANLSIGKADSTQSPLGNPVSLTNFRPDTDPQPGAIDLSSSELAMLLYGSLYFQNSMNMPDDLPMGSDSSVSSGAYGSTFRLMHILMGLKPSEWDEFFDQRKLSQAATSLLQDLALRFALTRLWQPALTDMQGTGMVTISQNKLHFRKEPLFLMTACFVLLACISIATLLLVRKRVVPQRFGSIASHATILTTSASVTTALDGIGHLRTSQLRRKLEELRFHVTLSNDKYSIEATRSPDISSPEVAHTWGKEEKPDDWIPFATRLPMALTLFLFPCAVIAALEFLQRTSDDNNGVVDLSDNSNATVTIYAARLSSTLVIFMAAMLFNNMDFAIAAFTPFSALRSGGVTARQASMLANLVGETPVLALYKSLRYRYFGTALSLIAALLGSLLTIMVSGLWTVDSQVMLPMAVTAETASWNLAWSNNSANDNGAASLLNMIDFGGATLPTSIWDGHVLPDIISWSNAPAVDADVGPSDSEGNERTVSNFKLEIPSLRPVLDCITATREDITYRNITIVLETDGGPSGRNRAAPALRVEARFDLPSGCWANPSRNSSNVTLGYDWYSLSSSPLIGIIFELDTGPGPLESKSTQQRLNETGCPSLGFLFGNITNPTALLCSQKMQMVIFDATYSGDPSFGIRDSRRPSYTIKNSSASTPILATDPTSGLPTFQYRIYMHLKTSLNTINYDSPIGIDEAFNHLFYAPLSDVNPNSLMGPENVANLIAAVNKMYNRYMTLVIDMNFRPKFKNTTEDQDPSADINKATVTVNGMATQQVTRLKMNNASKLTLQIMLGVMLLLMAVAVKMVKIRGTLPRSPLNIASVMGFLAGSTLCDPRAGIIPPRAEFMSRKDLTRLFEDQHCRLGWWDRILSPENSEVDLALYERGLSDERVGYNGAVGSRAGLKHSRFGIDVGSAEKQGGLLGVVEV